MSGVIQLDCIRKLRLFDCFVSCYFRFTESSEAKQTAAVSTRSTVSVSLTFSPLFLIRRSVSDLVIPPSGPINAIASRCSGKSSEIFWASESSDPVNIIG